LAHLWRPIPILTLPKATIRPTKQHGDWHTFEASNDW
jgi:hypothetical protein